MLRTWLFVSGLVLLGQRVSCQQGSFSLTDFSGGAVAQVVTATTATITTGGSLSCADPQHVAFNVALDGTPLPPGRMGFTITMDNINGATGSGPPTCTSGGMPSTVATGLVGSVAQYAFGDASIYLRAGHAPAMGTATPSNALTCFGVNVDTDGASQHNEISLCFSAATPTQVDASYWIGQLANGDVPTTTTISLGFDASQTYHTYGISWRTMGIQFLVDGVVVHTSSDDRLGYPWRAMNVQVLLRPTGSQAAPTVYMGSALMSVGALSYAAAAAPAIFGGPPSAAPSPVPSLAPTPLLPGTSWAPTAPSTAPTAEPTAEPSARPSAVPTFVATPSPTAQPTVPAPTALPTTPAPTSATPPPSAVPSTPPTSLPTVSGTATPSAAPSPAPTPLPTTARPTAPPSPAPSSIPSPRPSPAPTTVPSPTPSSLPSAAPTANPSMIPNVPTPTPSALPTQPSPAPSALPTAMPSPAPSALPTPSPSSLPSPHPSPAPTALPTPLPSPAPSMRPSPPPSPLSSMAPSTVLPTATPSLARPSPAPTRRPTSLPTALPSPRPTVEPSVAPTAMPLMLPSSMPPSLTPTWVPSFPPTVWPSPQPSRRPTIAPAGNNNNNQNKASAGGSSGSFGTSNLIILGAVVAVALVIIGTVVLWCRSRGRKGADAAAAANRGKRPGSGGHFEDFGGAASQRFGDEILQSYALGDSTANPIVGRTTPQERRSLARLSIDYKDRMSVERRESFGVARLSAGGGEPGGAGSAIVGPDLGNSRPPPMLRPFAHHPL